MASMLSAAACFSTRSTRLPILWVALFTVAWCQPGDCRAESWVEDSFADFADGRLDAAGQNIYVAADGTIRTIHRFDLNEDGWIDVLFNSTHDTYERVPATLATVRSDGGVASAPLAVEGSKQVVLSDLNQDGFLDAIFSSSRASFVPRITILYGGKDGWPPYRSSSPFPVHDARRLAVADLNADSRPDIVVLQKAWAPEQPEGNILSIFWGDGRGYLPSRCLNLGVEDAVDLASGDFDHNGAEDLVVLGSGGGLELFWARASAELPERMERSKVALPGPGATCVAVGDVNGDKQLDLIVGTDRSRTYIVPGSQGGTWGKPLALETPSATQISVGDLDGDRHADLVLTNFVMALAAGGEAAGAEADAVNRAVVWWGGPRGFSSPQSTPLDIRFITATAIGDLNGDGQNDLAAAIHQGSESFTTQSAILLGTGNRAFDRREPGPQTTGAIHVAIAPAEGKLPARAVFCNSGGGSVDEVTCAQVYWNGLQGFSPERRWDIPLRSGYEASAADLNHDGHTDLVLLNSAHSGTVSDSDVTLGANLFWGAADGFDLDNRRTVLRHRSLCNSNVADLDRDGYLDLVLGQFDHPPEVEELFIYYGSKDGFSPQRLVKIPSPGRSHVCLIADFNRDDWLDIALASPEKHLVRVLWGGEEGFAEERQAQIPVYLAIDLEAADLNKDGHLDLIVASFMDYVNNDPRNTGGTTILWGSPSGFSVANSQWLPGYSPLGHTVADFDADGHLDLLCPHYHAGITRESLPCYLFWGGPNGFDSRRRTVIMGDSAADALAADFDRDGKLDIALVCHTVDGDHRAESKILDNDGRRFENPRITRLPTHGPHWMWGGDMGHLYDRTWKQSYESSALAMKGQHAAGKLTFQAKTPEGARLEFAVRGAAQREELQTAAWRNVNHEGRFKLDPRDRWLQYRAVFRSDNGDRYAVLDRVEIELD
ncbi:MAG: VCBS repeat-containing protein [Pirellulales bacterium]|nr:VCBS repeat-containing protein [Pirellulales bacterium]